MLNRQWKVIHIIFPKSTFSGDDASKVGMECRHNTSDIHGVVDYDASHVDTIATNFKRHYL